jgi:hypothetical protein
VKNISEVVRNTKTLCLIQHTVYKAKKRGQPELLHIAYISKHFTVVSLPGLSKFISLHIHTVINYVKNVELKFLA